MIKPLRISLISSALAAVFAHASAASVRFIVVDPATGHTVKDANVRLRNSLGLAPDVEIRSGETFDFGHWKKAAPSDQIVLLKLGESRVIKQEQTEPPIKDIYITVTATRLRHSAADSGNSTTRTKEDINKFGGGNGDVKNVTKTTAGVAEDSGGQQHVRGEHTEITYVVDDVPLPDTLSGRAGAIVVPSTIQAVDIILGGFAPEFGGQTAAILNISTLPRAKRPSTELSFDGGTYNTYSGDLTAVGPLGDRWSYVLHFANEQTKSADDPQQPDNQTAHNAGSNNSLFGKFTYQASSKDRFNLTLSSNPDKMQIGNRTGLPSSFADAGQGFGFGGFRNADGSRPDVGPDNMGTLGSGNILLGSQDAEGQDINQRESNEFATLAWRRQVDDRTVAQLGLVFLHSGQDVTNRNPNVDVLNLPVDASIEFNPTASRNIHHVQLSGSLSKKQGAHNYKIGFLLDKQSGNEAYQIIPASQLALDALAASAPNLAPEGTTNGDMDVNGNPVYTPTSGETPVLRVKRDGHYYAAYVQDTWQASKKLSVNYGLRSDWYRQTQNLGQPTVDKFELCPRINLSYGLNQRTVLRTSYNRLFNTPPLAQGAIIGEPIQPPILDQYDFSIEHQVNRTQSVKLAYYYKQIRNQVDVGLLIPGSEIGLFTGVNLERGGVHGLEFSYEISAPKGIGWDGYFNYTLSAAKPKGVDNTGEEVDEFNDHDQRHTVGLGLAYTFKSGASAAMTFQYGSGLASSIVPPSVNRTPRSEVSLHLSTGDKLFHGFGGIGLDVQNLFDSRDVINFQSAFSGTRFQQGRRIVLTAFFKF